jgi:uncharacterized membrane protein
VRYEWNILQKGLAAIFPVSLTLYLIYWLVTSIERVLRPAIAAVVPESYYLPGMGLAAGLVLLFFIGLVVNAWIVQRLLHAGERLLERIPLIKSVYGALRDFMNYFSAAEQRRDLKQVVMITLGGTRLLGFVTQERIEDLPGVSLPDDVVAVYLPMSYQIGGYTLYVPRSLLEPVDLTIEDAMRRILTAGLSKTEQAKAVRAGADA